MSQNHCIYIYSKQVKQTSVGGRQRREILKMTVERDDVRRERTGTALFKKSRKTSRREKITGMNREGKEGPMACGRREGMNEAY